MQTIQQIIERLGRIDDATLVGAEEAELLQQTYRALVFTEWEGIVVRAPASVDLNRGQGLPILVAWRHGANREREVVLGDNAVVIAERLGGKGLWVTPLFPPAVLKNPMPDPEPAPPRPADAATPAGSMGVQRLDLIAQRGLPRQAGRYAVRVISFDWISNTVPVVVRGPEAPAEPAVPAKTAAGRMSLGGQRGPRSPAVAGIGVALSPFPPEVSRRGPMPAYGALRVPASPAWLAAGVGPAAVLDGFLVLVRRGILTPTVLDIEVPIRVPPGTMPGLPVDAWFAYDLNALAAERLPASLWQVYAIVGGYIAGPVALNVTE
jgi:hypothetical protein